MTRAELRDLNRHLARFGQRFCPGCGATLALTEDYWYFSRKGRDRTKLRPSATCKRCFRLRIGEQERKRYRKDKKFRQAKADYRKAYFAIPAKLQRHRERNRRYMQARRRAHLINILQFRREQP